MIVSLQDLGLVDSPPEATFDNLTCLASQIVGTPVALVSIVDFEEDRQFFKSQIGLAEPWATERQSPLSHSFCRHVVTENAPLVVENAHENPLVKDNLAVPELDVVAYLGVPIYAPGNLPVGALCVIDSKPRAWAEQDTETMKRLAACASDAIRMKAAIKTSEQLRSEQRLFSYAFSHDLKTPANSLRLALQEISEEAHFSETGREILDDGIAMIDRMSQQVEDVLAYTRSIDAELVFDPVDLNRLLGDVIEDLSAEITASGAVIRLEDLPVVTGFDQQLKSLFLSLLSNACRYRKKDTAPIIEVSATEVDGAYSISVSDNGIGIAPQHKDKIFQLFARLHTRADYPGTGIGLTLCQRVAENHRGKILVNSEFGAGSTFTLLLPKDPD